MKRLAYFFFLPLIFSCGEKSAEKDGSGNVLENLTFTVDTVMVNPGDWFFNLKYGLDPSTLSDDEKKLFFLERDSKRLFQIDLETLEVSNITKLETEGPNGVGPFVTTMSYFSEGKLFFGTYRYSGIFNINGVKLDPKKILTEKIQGQSGESESTFHFSPVLSSNGRYVFSLPRNEINDKFSFSWFDFEENYGEVMRLPRFDTLSQFTIQVGEGGKQFKLLESGFIQAFDKTVLIRTAAFSDVYHFDPITKKLTHKVFHHRLVPNRRNSDFNGRIESIQEVGEARAKLFQDIRFEEFLWDKSRNYYFRFGAKNRPKRELKERIESEVFLFSYDQKFNLIGETRINSLTKVPEYPFFKDGKLWSYVNVDDELGFAVMDFKF